MRYPIVPRLLLGLSAICGLASAALGQDTGAKTNGNWEDSTIWTGAAVPGSGNNVYIGSTYPAGAAGTATVTLTASESANNVYLGNGSGTSGTLDLGGNTLTITNNLVIGQNGGTGSINEGGGSFTATNLSVQNGNSFTFGANDAVRSVQLSGGSSVTTAASGNITTASYSASSVGTGSTLTLGTDLNMNTGQLNVQDSGSTFDMGGHALSAYSLLLGWNGSSAVNLANRGALTLTQLYVGNGMAFDINAGDAVNTFSLSGGTSTLNAGINAINLYNGAVATTTAAGGISSSGYQGSNVETGSTLTLGTDLNMNTGQLNVQDSGSTLDMAGHSLSAYSLLLGWNGSSAVNLANRGALTLTNLYVGNGMAFDINAGDAVNTFSLSGGTSTLNAGINAINLYNGAVATTTAAGGISTSGFQTSNVATGSTLTLGTDLNMNTGQLNVQDSGSTLDMAGHSLTAYSLLLGWNGSSAVNLANRGALTLTNLYVGNGMAFDINAGDAVNTFSLSGGTSTLNAGINAINLYNGAVATTTAAGGISTSGFQTSNVATGSTLTLGTDLNMNTGQLNVQDSGSTLDMAGHSLTAYSLLLGWNGSSAVNLANRGALTLTNLYVGNGMAFDINASDAVNTFNLSGGTSTLNAGIHAINLYNGAVATTTAAGGISTSGFQGSNVATGSTLTLGTDLNMNTGQLNVQDSGSTLDMAGHSLSAYSLLLGWNGSSAVNLANRGALTLTNLYVGNGMAFDINTGDAVNTFNLSGGTSTLNAGIHAINLSNGAVATTTAAGGISTSGFQGSNVATGSTLTLGADLNMNTGQLNVQDAGSTLNMAGHSLTAYSLLLGWNGTSPVTVTNAGVIDVTNLYLGNGTAVALPGGSVVDGAINLAGNSVLTVDQVGGMGLTLNGTDVSSLSIDSSSMDLVFTTTTPGNWDFRWKDPSSTSNWVSTLETMIADGEITLTLLPGQSYSVMDNPDGYTYIYGTAIPEPSSIVLAGIAGGGLMIASAWRRGRRRRRGR